MGLGCGACAALLGNVGRIASSDQMDGWAIESQENALNGMGITAEEMAQYNKTAFSQGAQAAQLALAMQGKAPPPTNITVTTDTQTGQPRREMDWTETMIWVLGGAAVVGAGIMLVRSMAKKPRALATNPRALTLSDFRRGRKGKKYSIGHAKKLMKKHAKFMRDSQRRIDASIRKLKAAYTKGAEEDLASGAMYM